jgi:hypothetical protein
MKVTAGNQSEVHAMLTIETIEQLEALYGQPAETSLVKETRHIIPEYASLSRFRRSLRWQPAGRKDLIAARAATSRDSCAFTMSAR